MNIKFNGSYMIISINEKAKMKKISFTFEDGEVLSFDARIDNVAPQFDMYYPVGKYKGRCATVTVTPEMDFLPHFTENKCADGTYSELHRPRLHFTAPHGWTNDPNGLIKFNGVYNMFYQHNPCDTCWNNMHWGHAISTDLIHWEDVGDVLYPDLLGAEFSGSAISAAGEEGFYLFYTSAGNKFTQCRAYTKDGIHFEKEGIVLEHIIAENRDPKVVFCKSSVKYIMALFLNEDKYALFESDNLKKWKLLQEIRLQGDAECPDFYPLYVNGDINREKWIFSGASDKYIIGSFDGKTFTPETEVKSLSWGSQYAAQTFSGIDGDRVRISWNRYQHTGERFISQMTFPGVVSLKENSDGMFLTINPIETLKTLFVGSPQIMKGNSLHRMLEFSPYYVEIKLSSFHTGSLKMDIFGMTAIFNGDKQMLDCSGVNVPLIASENGGLCAKILVDRQGLEFFINGGVQYVVAGDLADPNLCALDAEYSGEGELCVTLCQLADIYTKDENKQ